MHKRIYVCIPDATCVCNFFVVYPNEFSPPCHRLISGQAFQMVNPNCCFPWSQTTQCWTFCLLLPYMLQ